MSTIRLQQAAAATGIFLAAGFVLPMAGGTVHAQSSAVRLDFRAVTDDGTPVADLKAADVTLRIGGKPREITSLDLVRPSGTGAAKAPASVGPASPPFVTNVSSGPTGGGGRTLLIVIDDESIAAGREAGAKAAMSRLVTGLTPGDRVGLLSVRRSGGANIAPSTNHASVTAAIDAIRGQATSENAEAFKCRTEVTLQILQSVLARTAGDTPTVVVFLSASLSAPGTAMAEIKASSELCRLTPDKFEQVGAALAGSRAQLFVGHVAEGTTMSMTDAAPGVENIAGVTGTETFRISGDGEVFAARVLKETSAYYVATFAPEPSDRSGTSQRVELRVARDGVKVKARPAFALPRAETKPAKASPRDMLRVGTTWADLPLRAAGYASRNPGDNKVKVVALFEAAEPMIKVSSAVVGLFSSEGKLVAQTTVSDAELGKAPVMVALVGAPGEYRMRVAAVDINGRAGTVDVPIKGAMVQAGAMTMSTPLLGLPPSQASPSFTPRLVFRPGDMGVLSYVELYGVAKGAANLTVRLELARSEDGPALGSSDGQVRPGPGEDVRLLLGGFGLDTIQPGDYVVRTILLQDGKEVGRAMSTMRKEGA